jgi:hypothetical protein
MAISGEIPKRPLRKAESVFRDTPSPSAASVTHNPNPDKAELNIDD